MNINITVDNKAAAYLFVSTIIILLLFSSLLFVVIFYKSNHVFVDVADANNGNFDIGVKEAIEGSPLFVELKFLETDIEYYLYINMKLEYIFISTTDHCNYYTNAERYSYSYKMYFCLFTETDFVDSISIKIHTITID